MVMRFIRRRTLRRARRAARASNEGVPPGVPLPLPLSQETHADEPTGHPRAVLSPAGVVGPPDPRVLLVEAGWQLHAEPPPLLALAALVQPRAYEKEPVCELGISIQLERQA